MDTGITTAASVPSGASIGENEALELRDGDKKRYGGKDVLQAVANVNEKIGPNLVGIAVNEQEKIDRLMIQLDGTPIKSNRVEKRDGIMRFPIVPAKPKTPFWRILP